MYRASCLIPFVLLALADGSEPDAKVDYLTHVKPILALKCYSCHGALKQQSELRLETRALMLRGGENGPVVQPGQADKSPLIQRITAAPGDRMPPAGEGSALTVAEVSLIRRWIDQGARAPAERIPASASEHWSFRPLGRPRVPVSADPAWARNAIDAFIGRQHDEHGLVAQHEAPREVLLRRLYFDLIGLPPTADEIALANNESSSLWYARTVERLLSDPRHGERWARHWMDIWRYSDWSGFGGQLRASQKHIWHWRDWIVESLNDDKPYDEMVRLMLAADESHPNDLNRLRATGYLARNYVLFNRNQWLDDVVEHVSKGFLGLSMKCAKCHDHKYDPIAQRDYYAMRAFFEPYHVRLDVVPGQPDLKMDGIPRAFEGLINKPTFLFQRGDENRPDKSSVVVPGVPDMLAFRKLTIQPVQLPIDAWQPARRPWVSEASLRAATEKVAAATKAMARFASPQRDKNNRTDEQRVAECSLEVAKAELESVRRRVVAMRAVWVRAEENDGRVAAAVGDEEKEKAMAAVRAERQLAVAQARKSVAEAKLLWSMSADDKKGAAKKKLTDAEKSLQASLKQAQGPVRPNDRYTRLMGAAWTPTRFFKSTRDDPIVKFVPTSSGRRTALANWITDPRNPLTARVAVNHLWTRHLGKPLVTSVFDFGRNGKMPSHPQLVDWLAAELISSGWSMKHLHRLIVTSATYRMSSSAAGRPQNLAKDRDNLRWWRRDPIRLESQAVRDSILLHAGTLDQSLGGPSVEPSEQPRSIRRSLYFFHSANDRNPFLTVFDEAMVKECYQRQQSIVPQQALALSNSKLVLDASAKIAQRLSDLATDETEFVRRAFLQLLGIEATDEEIAASRQALRSWISLAKGNATKARSRLIWALINHNDFITLR